MGFILDMSSQDSNPITNSDYMYMNSQKSSFMLYIKQNSESEHNLPHQTIFISKLHSFRYIAHNISKVNIIHYQHTLLSQ